MRDITLEETVYFNFTTRALTGIPTTLSGSPALSVLESNNATPITSGVSLQVDRASVAGLNQATIVATAANGYEAGKSYAVYISTGTVDSVSVVGEVVAEFTVQAGAAFTRIGAAGAGLTDLASASLLSTVAGYLDTEIAAIKTKTDFLPSATAGSAGGLLIAGANAATSFTGGIVITQSTADEPGLSITGNGGGSGVHIVGGSSEGNGLSISSGTDGAAVFLVGEGDGHAFYAGTSGAGSGMFISAGVRITQSVTNEPGLSIVGNGTGGDIVAGEIAAIKAVTDALPDSGALTSLATAAALATVDANVDSILVDTAEIGAAGAGLTALPWNAAWDAQVESEVADALAAYDAATGTDVTSATSGLATAANLATVAGYLDTEIAAILADTNELQTDWANGGRLDLILDARASQTSVDAIDTAVDSILVDTAEIGTAGAGLTALATAAALATVDANVDSILVTTNKLDDTLEDDGGTYRFTANALEEAPSGTGASAASIVAAMFTVDTGETEADAVAGSVVYEIVQNAGGGSAPTVGEIADEVQTRTIAAVTLVNGLAANSVTASALASDAVTEIQSGLATAAALTTVDTVVDGIKAVTDALPDSGALTSLATAAALATVDSNVDSILVDTAEIGAAGAGLTALASASGLSTLSGYVDTEVAAIKAKTDNLPSDPADQSLIIAAADAIVALIGTPAGASVSADVAAVKSDSAAIKTKTDSLTFTVANQVRADVRYVNGTQVTGNGSPGSEWGPL